MTATFLSSCGMTPAPHAILFKTSDTTWQAYNDYGGANLYTGGPGPQSGAYKVSYNRPYHTRVYEFYSWIFNAEYPMIRFLEANGYDVTYFSSLDADRFGSLDSCNTKCSCRSAMTNTGQETSAPMSKPHERRALTWDSSAETRSFGKSAGNPVLTAPTRPTGPWFATRRRTRTELPILRIRRSGPAPGATPASALQETEDVLKMP